MRVFTEEGEEDRAKMRRDKEHGGGWAGSMKGKIPQKYSLEELGERVARWWMILLENPKRLGCEKAVKISLSSEYDICRKSRNSVQVAPVRDFVRD